MTELSPAAQAVLHAFWNAPVSPSRNVQVAAALRALADQVVPEPDDWTKDAMSTQGLRLLRLKRDQILAIAAELEGRS